jgi:hypothetical protein
VVLDDGDSTMQQMELGIFFAQVKPSIARPGFIFPLRCSLKNMQEAKEGLS